jgi:hypothetical protein
LATPKSVHVCQATPDRLHQIQSLVRIHAPDYPILEIAALKIFHGEVMPLACNTDVVDGNDIVMIQ